MTKLLWTATATCVLCGCCVMRNGGWQNPFPIVIVKKVWETNYVYESKMNLYGEYKYKLPAAWSEKTNFSADGIFVTNIFLTNLWADNIISNLYTTNLNTYYVTNYLR